jgi:hypothetical protein
LEIVWTGYGEDYDNSFGAGACGGDFNNDGFSDVLIGAWGWNSEQGKDYLYIGSDEYFIEASYFFYGDDPETNDSYDLDVSNVQDVNGDEIEDFLIPGSYRRNGGYVDIYFGGDEIDTIPDWRVQKSTSAELELFGVRNDSAGDVNGDGWNDFVIAGGENHPTYTSYFEIYFGGFDLDTIPDWHYTSDSYLDYKFYVNGLGDINGDGFDDVMAYKPVSSVEDPYPCMIFLGGSPMDTIPDLEFYPYASSAAGVGDVNGDGFNDIAMSKWIVYPDSGGAHVYFGGADVDTIADVKLHGYFAQGSGGPFTCADVNGDGISDILGRDSGGINLFLGSPWFNGTADWWYSEYWMIDGYTCNGVGDVNDDGCDEIVLGINGYLFDQGKAHLFAGNPDLVDLGAGIAPEDLLHTPGWFALDQNYPNPFNASTTIHFELGRISVVNLTIYDLRGQRIRQLIEAEEMIPGGYNVAWSGINEFGQPVASGIYMLELQVDEYKDIRKMVLLR